ncbi:hypothetical protein AHF37_12036 [Paragonimus kellicotti]|nr:hypothetical protein AHF37_12036 [Paragonimus kellicotti]
MRSTVVELLKLANISLQLKSKFEKYLIQQAVGALQTIYNVQTRILDWIKMLQEQITSVTITPLADVCREFGAYLVEQVPGLEPLKQLVKTSLAEFGQLFMKNVSCVNSAHNFVNCTPGFANHVYLIVYH